MIKKDDDSKFENDHFLQLDIFNNIFFSYIHVKNLNYLLKNHQTLGYCQSDLPYILSFRLISKFWQTRAGNWKGEKQRGIIVWSGLVRLASCPMPHGAVGTE